MLTTKQILEANPTLTPYRVSLYEVKGDKALMLFECYAEDAAHALEQAVDAYPESAVWTINPFSGDEHETT